jgi:S1-C subfamily serine protease
MALAVLHRASRAGAPPLPSVAGFEHRVYTLLDYYENGRRAVDAFIRDREASGTTPALAETVRRCKDYCVRLDVRFDRGSSRVESAVATGVLVQGGRRVLTAGHTFEGAGDVTVVVTYPDGKVRGARLAEREYDRFGTSEHDWALLDIADAPIRAAAPLSTGSAGDGETVIVLGYPDEIGIDASGNVAYTNAAGPAYHEPLTTLAVVERPDPLLLNPAVGSIPTRGMSGGPVFDLEGKLLGVFVAVNASRVAGAVTHAYEVCSARVAREPRVVSRDPRAAKP